MTDKKKLELISGYVQKCYHESYYDMYNAIADIANLLESESAPITPEPGESGQSASAKEFLSKTTAVGVIERKGVGEYSMTFDVDKLAPILTTYASQVCADKDREIQRLNDKVQGIQEFMDKRRTQREQLESEIDGLNESLTVLLRKNAELLKSVRPEVVVPKKIEIDYDEPVYYRKKAENHNMLIDKIKSLNPDITFTELNHEK